MKIFTMAKMKKSRKYLLGTVLGIYAVIFAVIGANRASESMGLASPPEPTRTPVAQLDTLENFDRVNSRGDFILEIVQQAGYSVTYSPADGSQGDFEARRENGVLILEGFGSGRNVANDRVRIGMPSLTALTSTYNPQVSISGFEQDRIRLDISVHDLVTLSNSSFGTLEINASFVDRVALDMTTAATEVLTLSGRSTITR